MSDKKTPVILMWFRQDLRLHDNLALKSALDFASDHNMAVVPIYILDDQNAGSHAMGGASRWWLHHSLNALKQDLLDDYGLSLTIMNGNALPLFEQICTNNAIHHVMWNRCYEPWRVKRDTHLKTIFKDHGVAAQSFNSSFLFEPHLITKKDGSPYKVFTPYYKKACLQGHGEPRAPIEKPQKQAYKTAALNAQTLQIDELDLLPSISWDTQIKQQWQAGEKAALNRMESFFTDHLSDYKDGRNYMSKPNISRLSPHLHFGEISPFTLWHEARTAMATQHCENDGEHFLSELGWREFSYYLLYHFPTIPTQNFQKKFDAFPWDRNDAALLAWQQGKTGYPIVDAAMRELWQTGYMHNRARMIVGSFLVKHLRLHWHHGERWFWDTLLDADLASNSASWQWIAGSGADAAPYFRIFNPITQGQKFDPDGAYTRRYVPEIAKLPNKYLHCPWTAPDHILQQANLTLGTTYPAPIVDHSTARALALESFSSLSSLNISG